MKLGEMTFSNLIKICVANRCMDCPLLCSNIQGIGHISSYKLCIKSLGMHDLMEVLDVEIPELDDK